MPDLQRTPPYVPVRSPRRLQRPRTTGRLRHQSEGQQPRQELGLRQADVAKGRSKSKAVQEPKVEETITVTPDQIIMVSHCDFPREEQETQGLNKPLFYQIVILIEAE